MNHPTKEVCLSAASDAAEGKFFGSYAVKRKMSKFKEKVCKVVSKIPKGKTMSYKEVAEKAGFPKAWRAVGNLMNKNKNPKVPCHRVIKSDRKPGGFFGGTKKKIALLKKEGAL
jgi:methylated-DNA-[protein]-cysteine S-methyltransferase